MKIITRWNVSFRFQFESLGQLTPIDLQLEPPPGTTA